MKKCFKCGEEKPLSDFYRHARMADGHLNKCKVCTKADMARNRKDKIDHYRAYDRERGNRQTSEYFAEYRKRYPNKARARNKVAYEVSKGNLTSKPCEECGDAPTHAHHPDYSRPLDIQWLCPACHKAWHQKHGEGLNP